MENAFNLPNLTKLELMSETKTLLDKISSKSNYEGLNSLKLCLKLVPRSVIIKRKKENQSCTLNKMIEIFNKVKKMMKNRQFQIKDVIIEIFDATMSNKLTFLFEEFKISISKMTEVKLTFVNCEVKLEPLKPSKESQYIISNLTFEIILTLKGTQIYVEFEHKEKIQIHLCQMLIDTIINQKQFFHRIIDVLMEINSQGMNLFSFKIKKIQLNELEFKIQYKKTDNKEFLLCLLKGLSYEYDWLKDNLSFKLESLSISNLKDNILVQTKDITTPNNNKKNSLFSFSMEKREENLHYLVTISTSKKLIIYFPQLYDILVQKNLLIIFHCLEKLKVTEIGKLFTYSKQKELINNYILKKNETNVSFDFNIDITFPSIFFSLCKLNERFVIFSGGKLEIKSNQIDMKKNITNDIYMINYSKPIIGTANQLGDEEMEVINCLNDNFAVEIKIINDNKLFQIDINFPNNQGLILTVQIYQIQYFIECYSKVVHGLVFEKHLQRQSLLNEDINENQIDSINCNQNIDVSFKPTNFEFIVYFGSINKEENYSQKLKLKLNEIKMKLSYIGQKLSYDFSIKDIQLQAENFITYEPLILLGKNMQIKDPFLETKLNVNFTKMKIEIDLKIQNLLFIYNCSIITKLSQLYLLFMIFHENIESDNKYKRDCVIIEGTKTQNRGINGDVFQVALQKMPKFKDKSDQEEHVQEIFHQISLNNNFASKKIQYGKEILKIKKKISAIIKDIKIKIPLNETENNPVIEISFDNSFQLKDTKNYCIFKAPYLSFKYYDFDLFKSVIHSMISNVIINIVDNNNIYPVLSKLRVLFSFDKEIVKDRNGESHLVTNISINIEPIYLQFNIKFAYDLKEFLLLLNKLSKEISENNIENYVNQSLNPNDNENDEKKNERNKRKKLHKRAKKILKKFKFERQYNYASFNCLTTMNILLDTCEFKVYFCESQNIKPKYNLLRLHIFQTKLEMISNNDPSDGINMSNALIEIISGKEVPFEQFNIETLYNYLLVNLNFSVSYFNEPISCYEPLIEPYNIKFRVSKTEKMIRRKVDIESNQIMNINITSNWLNVMNTILKKISEKSPKDDNVKKSGFLIFRNETGMNISFQFDNSNNGKKFELNPSKENEKECPNKSFTKEEVDQIIREQKISRFNINKITFEVENFGKRSYDISNLNSTIFKLETLTSYIYIGIIVIMKDFRREIIFSSGVKIKNMTDKNFLIYNSNDELQKTQYELPRGGVFNVPLYWLQEKSDVYLMIDNNKQEETKLFQDFSIEYFIPTQNVNNEPNEILAKGKFIEIEETRGENNTLETVKEFLSIDIYSFKPSEENSDEMNFFDIVIMAPVQIENQIPSQCKFKFIAHELKRITEYEMKFKENSLIYFACPLQNRVSFRLSIEKNGINYESILFNIFSLLQYLTLISYNEDQFKCSVKIVSTETLYQYSRDIFNFDESKSDILSKKFIFYFDYLIINRINEKKITFYSEESMSCITHLFDMEKVEDKKEYYLSSFPKKVAIAMQFNNIPIKSEYFPLEIIDVPILVKFNKEKILNSLYSKNCIFPDYIVLVKSSPDYSDTLIVYLDHKFSFINKTKYNFTLENASTKEKVEELKALEETQLKKKGKCELFSLKLKEFHSDSFEIDQIGESDIKLQVIKNDESFSYDGIVHYILIRVKIQTNGGKIKIILTEPKFPLLQIQNKTNVAVDFQVSPNELITLNNDGTYPFVFKRKNNQHNQLVCRIDSTFIYFSFSQLGNRLFTDSYRKNKDENSIKYIVVSVTVENGGQTRRFTIAFKEEKISDKTIIRDYILKKQIPKATRLKCSLFGIVISFIDSTPKEFFYLSLYGIDFKYTKTIQKITKKEMEEQKQMEKFTEFDKMVLFVKNIQLDCGLKDLSKTFIRPKFYIIPSNEEELKQDKLNGEIPFLQILICREIAHSGFKAFEKFPRIDIVLQEFEIYFKKNIIQKIIELCNQYLTILDYFYQTKVKQPIEDDNDEKEEEKNIILINYLFISGIKFKIYPDTTQDQSQFNLNLLEIPGHLSKIITSLLVSLSNVKEIEINYNETMYQDIFSSFEKIIYELFQYFISVLMKQTFEPKGDSFSDYKLINGLGTGFCEIINLPRIGFLFSEKYFAIDNQVKKLLKNILTKPENSICSLEGFFLSPKEKRNLKNKPLKITNRDSYYLKELEGQYSKQEDFYIDGIKNNFLCDKEKENNIVNIVKKEMKSSSIKIKTSKIKTSRFRFPRAINQMEPLTVYDEHLAEVQELLYRFQNKGNNIFKFNKIFLSSDIQMEGYTHNLTLILTDSQFLVIDKLNTIILQVDINEITNCKVYFKKNMYVIILNILNSKNNDKKERIRKGIRLYEQEVAYKIYELLKKEEV